MRAAQTGVMRRLLTLALVLAACGTPPAAVATPAQITTIAPSIAPTAAPVETPGAAQPPPRPPFIEAPSVTVDESDFPIVQAASALVLSAAVELTEHSARLGVTMYLESLDRYRNTGRLDQVPIAGPFRDAVLTSLNATKRDGVQRKFGLDSMRVDRVYVKPWGTQALVDVTVTITDRVVAGSAAAEVETGRLRLAGDRGLMVFDGWDGAAGRWFNGTTRVTRERLFAELKQQPFGWYLKVETWRPGIPIETYYSPGGETAFSRSRNAFVQAFDRSAMASRTLVDVTARVERFETLTEIGDGIATVRFGGIVVTQDAAGLETRAPFAKTVRAFRKAFANGNGSFTVVDELGPDGAWLSGGDLALKDLDQSFG